MKKTTIYRLLCTTIMFSGVSLAAEDPSTPISKQTKAKLTELQQQGGLSTPEIESKARSKYASNPLLTPSSKDFYTKMETEHERVKRDQELEKKRLEIRAYEERQRTLRAEEEKREKEQTAQKELVERAKEAAARKDQTNLVLEQQIKELTSQVSSLRANLESAESDLSKASAVKQFSREQIVAMSQQLQTKEKELFALMETLRTTESKVAGLEAQVVTEKQAKERFEQGLQEIIGQTGSLDLMPPTVPLGNVDETPSVPNIQPSVPVNSDVQKPASKLVKADFGGDSDEDSK